MTGFDKKDLTGIADLSAEEINFILETASSMKESTGGKVKKVPALRGVTVANLFFEPSTRTKASFEIAEKRLSADVLNFSVSQSSVAKGESLLDTAKNLEAMGAEVIVIRHGMSGAPHLLARQIGVSVVNAGDGANEHPSQALLDMLTIRRAKGRIKGLRVVIVGDILNSRVARSNIHALLKLGASVGIAGPCSMLPAEFSAMGVDIFHSMEEALPGADVVIMLRVQSERESDRYFPSLREYFKFFGLTEERIKLAPPGLAVLHPGPINRGVELTSQVAYGPGSEVLEQVANGISVRMAILYLLCARRSGGNS
ncbi:MAG: aspartate carbamoyltransferase catalytic subunit [Candidatus Dadabacteria bacterium]|nr:aspartate carbamoyltransferase catalytic subunit [Candidatus Dadabacteria bacterium]MCY4043181.1 aspartate carbamoyltransferase catalytic subunit [Candidatus Dadabacteria bacterium]MCY4046712.1 aspartate carbamoyltransferase catalytic subunit [Candidatus Dadabacteria bacterium]